MATNNLCLQQLHIVVVSQLVNLCRENQKEIRSQCEDFSQFRSLMVSRLPSGTHPPPVAPMSAPSVRTILCLCRPLVFLHWSLHHPPHPKFPDLIDHLFLIVPPLCFPRFLWFSVRPTPPVVGVRFVLLPLGADIGALPFYPVPTPVGIVSRAAPAHCTSARCILHRRRVRVCSTVDCSGNADPKSVVDSCSAHHIHTQSGPVGGGPQSTLGVCRIPSLFCSERVHALDVALSTTSRCTFNAHSIWWEWELGEHWTRDPITCSARGDFQRTATLAA